MLRSTIGDAGKGALMEYGIYKLIHVVAVVLFLGNITTGVFWVRHAMPRQDPALLAHAMDGVIRSDRWFTMPGVFVIIAGGVAAAMTGSLPLMRTGWIAWGIAMFALSGIVFSQLAPLQRRIRDYAAGTGGARPEWATCTAMVRRWEIIGFLSLAPAWIALAMMVLKLPR
jgi:uncharacterized membrane protein